MTEEQKNTSKTEEFNPYCHAGMTCSKGCGCASEDGICRCKMMDDQKCMCNSACGLEGRF